MNSDFINRLFLNRRDALKTFAGLSAIATTSQTSFAQQESAASKASRALDYQDPHDNL